MKAKKKRKDNKKIIILALLIVALIILINKFPVFLKFIKYQKKNNSQDYTKSQTTALFKNYPNGIDKDTVLVQNAFYQIYYIKNDDLFLISIIGSPFKNIQPVAEKTFLSLLGTDEKSACNLNVKITTPNFANPDEAGKIHRLSFCNK